MTMSNYIRLLINMDNRLNEIRKNNDIIKILYHYTKDNYIQKMKKFLLWIYSIMSYIRKV